MTDPTAVDCHPTARMRHYNPDAQTLIGAMPLVAQAIGARHDIEVRFGADVPCTDLRVIHIPDLPFEHKRVSVLAFGWLEHEIAHVLETTPTDTRSDLHFELYGAVEDIRAECAFLQKYPGYRSDMDARVEVLLEMGRLRVPTEHDPPLMLLQRHLLYGLYSTVREQSFLGGFAEQTQAVLQRCFPAGACVRIASVMARVPTLRNSQESAALAGELLDILEEESREPPPPPTSSQGSPSDSPEATGESAQASSSEHSQPGGSSPSTAPTGPGPAQNGTQPTAPETGGTTPDAAAGEAEQRARLRRLLNSPAAQSGGSLQQQVGEALKEEADAAIAELDGEEGGDGRAKTPICPPSVSPGAPLAEVTAVTLALQARIRGLLASDRRPAQRHTRRGSRLDPRRIARLAQGDCRVFKQPTRKTDVLTAIKLLLDRSGSMAHPISDNTTQDISALLTLMSLDERNQYEDAFRNQHAQMIFDEPSRLTPDQRTAVQRSLALRAGRLHLAIRATLAIEAALAPIRGIAISSEVFPGVDKPTETLTRFGESVRQTAHRYWGVRASGGTPLYPALLGAANELLLRPEPRKIMLLVTDGLPAKPTLCRQTVDRCRRSGIEVYGIGIQVPEIQTLVPESRCIDDMSELSPAMFEVLQGALLRRHVA